MPVVPKPMEAHCRSRSTLFLLTAHVAAPLVQSCLQPLGSGVWMLGQPSGLCIR